MEKDTKKQQRKLLVLGHVVYVYITTAVPVSSRTVAQEMDGCISSATVRNIMAELEEEGYIDQRHTSSGRVPTHLGYRCYVDRIKGDIRFEKKEAERLAAEYSARIRTINEVIKKTSFLISSELRNASVVMWPNAENFFLKRIELVKVRAETVLAVLVTMSNAVKDYIIRLEGDLAAAELERVANYINAHYEQLPLSRISADLKREVLIGQGGESDFPGLAATALRAVDRIIAEDVCNEISLEGLEYFADDLRSGDAGMTRRIFRMFSEREDLTRLMRNELPDRGIRTYIGRENGCEMLIDCSVITCGYALHGKTAGRIGVIGPTRMDYAHALRTVSCLADLVSSKLEEINI
ncbi:MAG: heat-inducible transcriptional repressor HrcA [Candidatus Omnitrophota bacterium]